MKYVHPKEYKGVKFNTEHDFSECRMTDKWEDGKVVEKKTCPFTSLGVPIDIETLKNSCIKCEVEEV